MTQIFRATEQLFNGWVVKHSRETCYNGVKLFPNPSSVDMPSLAFRLQFLHHMLSNETGEPVGRVSKGFTGEVLCWAIDMKLIYSDMWKPENNSVQIVKQSCIKAKISSKHATLR